MRAADFCFLAALLLLAPAGCRRALPPRVAASSPAAAAAPRSAALQSELGPALPLFADDPAHPWNRVHQALFAPVARVSQTACLATASCDVVPTPMGFFGDVVEVSAPYADTPTQLMLPGVEQLLAAPRQQQIVHSLLDALAVAPGPEPVAAALLQNDLWERFDAIEQALTATDRDVGAQAALRELRDGLGALIRHLALPAAVLRALPANLPLLAAAHPDVLAGLAPASAGSPAAAPWAEVMTRSADQPRSFDPPLRDGSRHAMIAGYRAVFRVYVSIAAAQGGTAWLQAQLAQQPAFLMLPPGTRLAIAEQPLGISREGELVPLPLVTLVESRAVRAAAIPGQRQGTGAVTRLRELPFFAFEGKRQLLRAVAPGRPGLVRLDAAAPFPQGGTCSPRPELLQPLGGVCLMCHQPDSEHLTGTLSHGEQSLRVISDATAAARVTIEHKRERSDFKALQDYLLR